MTEGQRSRVFEVGDKVLVLLSMQHNRLKLEWIGPHTVVRKAPIVLVEKKDGGVRFCVVFRKLN